MVVQQPCTTDKCRTNTNQKSIQNHYKTTIIWNQIMTLITNKIPKTSNYALFLTHIGDILESFEVFLCSKQLFLYRYKLTALIIYAQSMGMCHHIRIRTQPYMYICYLLGLYSYIYALMHISFILFNELI